MLRKSTAFSPDIKRVLIDRGNDAATGVMKVRFVAFARVFVCAGGMLLVGAPIVRMGLVLRAILWRRTMSGSGAGLAMLPRVMV